MKVDVVVPEVGEVGMEVTFVGWQRQEGEIVHAGDVLFTVDTAKSIVEVEAFTDGTLVDLMANEGDVVTPHQVVARIVEPEQTNEIVGLNASDGTPVEERLQAPDGAHAGPVSGFLSASPPPTGGDDPGVGTKGRPASQGAADHLSVSPRARQAARSAHLDLATITGTGPNGLIMERDVETAHNLVTRSMAPDELTEANQELRPAPGGSTTNRDKANRVGRDRGERARRAMAALTTRSWQEVPQFSLTTDVDVESALSLGRPLPLVLIATARALAINAECNLAWSDSELIRRSSVDVGVLVDSADGLRVVTVPNADRLDIRTAEARTADVVGRARSGRLFDSDLVPRSITISNLGMYAVDSFTAIIVPPDTMVLAVGRARRCPHWDGDRLVPHRCISLTLTVDHRAVSGAAAARVFTTLQSLLGSPEQLCSI